MNFKNRIGARYVICENNMLFNVMLKLTRIYLSQSFTKYFFCRNIYSINYEML